MHLVIDGCTFFAGSLSISICGRYNCCLIEEKPVGGYVTVDDAVGIIKS